MQLRHGINIKQLSKSHQTVHLWLIKDKHPFFLFVFFFGGGCFQTACYVYFLWILIYIGLNFSDGGTTLLL